MSWPGHRDSDIDFYLMIIGSYPEVLRPHVIVLSRDRKPEAILVGRLERKQLAFKVGYMRPFRRWARCLTFVYGALRGNASPENTRILVGEVMNCLKRDEADVAMLFFVPLDTDLYQCAVKMPSLLCRDLRPASQEHYVMQLPDSIDDLFHRMSNERRKKLRRKIKKFESDPAAPLRVVHYRSESDLEALIRDAEEIARKTYQRGLGAGFADTPIVRERLQLAARRGWLRAFVLYLGERPCAFSIGMLYNETFLGEYVGYDPEFRRSSPGMFLLMRVVEGFCNRQDGDQVKHMDFGPGEAEYKAALCDKNWLEAIVYIFAPTGRGLTLKLMRTSASILDRAARRVLQSSRLLPWLKRSWRNRLAHRDDSGDADSAAERETHPEPAAPRQS